jgi:transcriptional regulator with PAS, ATPase and Fis domain
MQLEPFSPIIGQSPEFEAVLRNAKIVAKTDVSILIIGETGTGKEVLANAIQKAGERHNKPYIALNCAALPEGIVESELFGHRQGAFTGATRNKQGIFQGADGGTLFLDEINSLPLITQGKLLRFLETGECLPVGEIKPCKVNVRIIAATNSEMIKQIAAGTFRRDLYYRLNVVPLEIPPLRQRRDDIKFLIRHFIKAFSEEYGLDAPVFHKDMFKRLLSYPWPGNVRELRNLCERLSILLPGKMIGPENLPQEFQLRPHDTKTQPYNLPDNGVDLKVLEINLIKQALGKTNGNISKAARLLGLSRHTLLYRIQKYGLNGF